jgi:probable HAF family extracellular repeat protein
MRSLILFSGAALALLACTSEETPTGPSASTRPELALVKTYTVVDLGTLGGQSEAWGINPAGQVVGSSFTIPNQAGSAHAFLWENGVMTDLGTLGGGGVSEAFAINPAGQVVGRSQGGLGGEHAFLWEKGYITD